MGAPIRQGVKIFTGVEEMDITVFLWVVLMIVCLSFVLCFLTLVLIAVIISAGRCFSSEMRVPKEWEKADRELKERIKHQYD